jgi:hypothetical protein
MGPRASLGAVENRKPLHSREPNLVFQPVAIPTEQSQLPHHNKHFLLGLNKVGKNNFEIKRGSGRTLGGWKRLDDAQNVGFEAVK